MNRGQKYIISELLKAFGFTLACGGFVPLFLGYNGTELFFKMPQEVSIIALFIGFVFSMLCDALQRKYIYPKPQKPEDPLLQTGFQKFILFVKKGSQSIVSFIYNIEIVISFLALPVVIAFSNINYKDVLSKVIVGCAAMLFCFKMVYIIDILDLFRKKE